MRRPCRSPPESRCSPSRSRCAARTRAGPPRSTRSPSRCCSGRPRCITGASGRRARHAIMKRLDHSMIFVFIAGTYTPIAVLTLPRTAAIAVLAVGLDRRRCSGWPCRPPGRRRPRWLSVPCYIGLGWVAVFVLPDLLHDAGLAAFVLIAAGGVIYTLGARRLRAQASEPGPPHLRVPRGLPQLHVAGRDVPLRRDLVRPLRLSLPSLFSLRSSLANLRANGRKRPRVVTKFATTRAKSATRQTELDVITCNEVIVARRQSWETAILSRVGDGAGVASDVPVAGSRPTSHRLTMPPRGSPGGCPGTGSPAPRR